MDIHDGLFYVANTGRGTVEVIDPSGSVVRTMEFPTDETAARTTGIYVADDGSAYVSDATTGRVGIFGPDGEFQAFFGEAGGPGAISFSHPAGLTVDAGGNLYVAEFTVGRVQKLSSVGRHLAMFEMVPGAVNVSEATDVVIGDNGFLYMADNKRSIVHVFAESGGYLGIVGLVDATRRDSTGALLRPYGLEIQGDRLTVIDRVRGQLNFQIIPEYFLQEPTS
jgi:DNA-binding beta-propeller fold protein YncE